MASRDKTKAKTASKGAKAAPDVQFDVITPPNVLKVKVGGGSAAFDDGAVARAEGVLKDLAANFAAWMQDDIERLHTAFAAYVRTPGEPAAREAFHTAAHDLKGEAATLGLPLLGRVAGSLTRLLTGDIVPPEALLADHVSLVDTLFKLGAAGETEGLDRTTALEASVAAFLGTPAASP